MNAKKSYRFAYDEPRTTGRRQVKGICPKCGKRSLVRYVDTLNNFAYLPDHVGKCDHEQSCGYWYSAREWQNDEGGGQSWQSFMQSRKPQEPQREEFATVPMEIITKSVPTADRLARCNFLAWLQKIGFSDGEIMRAVEAYRLGGTSRGEIIFPEISPGNVCRAAKIMQYSPDGHRRPVFSFRDEAGELVEIGVDWVESRLRKLDAGKLGERKKWMLKYKIPEGKRTAKHLFGLHLLNTDQAKPVAIVESEKTAVLFSMIDSRFLWMATGGCQQIKAAFANSLGYLRNRTVVLFPDRGMFDEWAEMAKKCGLKHISVNALLERPGVPPNFDLADFAAAIIARGQRVRTTTKEQARTAAVSKDSGEAAAKTKLEKVYEAAAPNARASLQRLVAVFDLKETTPPPPWVTKPTQEPPANPAPPSWVEPGAPDLKPLDFCPF